jgi:hypothetical protein
VINSHTDALEGLRNALAQLHDVNVYYKGLTYPTHKCPFCPDDHSIEPEHVWHASTALDWTRTALHYGEQAALTETLARYGTGHEDCGPLCPVHGDPRLTNIAPHSATESVTEF